MCPTVLQFRIDTEGTKPIQWRRIRVCDRMTVRGFVNYINLLFDLQIQPQDHELPINIVTKQDDDLNVGVKKRLKHLRLQPGTKFIWEDYKKKTRLLVRVEAILMSEAGVNYPICLKKTYQSSHRKNQGLEHRILNNL